MKVLTVVGTRPEIIRLAAVLRRLDRTSGIEHALVHTGQNWDHRLNGIFFEELGLRLPDHVLDVDVSSLGATLGDILRKTEAVLTTERPDAFLVLGDTNSALSLIMAKRMQIPTYHMEAGNRCFDANVPEETNRRLVDHTADFNLAYTEHARGNLLAEGLHPRRVIVTGSPMNEVLDLYREQISASPILGELGVEPQGYLLVSAHREENVDSPARLRSLLECLNRVVEYTGLPALVSTHPRTRKRLELLAGVVVDPRIAFHPPFGFLDYNRLQLEAACVLSDSGTIAEESTMLGFPAVTLRSSIERPEALDTGSITMTDLDPQAVVAAVGFARARPSPAQLPADYSIRNTSERVVNLIMSTAFQHRFWSGLR
ncbi:MAG: non-hydrolyzing UDP-N-acetylglucosamine 2-epimerase [Candidatus Nanopelagicales bacterium]